MVEKEKKMDLQKVRADMDVRAELDFLMDDFSKKKSMIEQDKKAFELMEKEGKDPRDSFRVLGIEDKEGERPVLRIVSSGEKGFNKARETLSTMKKRVHISVENETSERYEKDSPGPWTRKIEEMMEEKLRKLRGKENDEV